MSTVRASATGGLAFGRCNTKPPGVVASRASAHERTRRVADIGRPSELGEPRVCAVFVARWSGSVLEPFRLHGWSAEIVREVDRDDCIEIAARRGTVATRIAVLYSSSGISNARYKELSNEVARIFFSGQPYMLDSFARGCHRSGGTAPRLFSISRRREQASGSGLLSARHSAQAADGSAAYGRKPPRCGHRTPAAVHEPYAGPEAGREARRNGNLAHSRPKRSSQRRSASPIRYGALSTTSSRRRAMHSTGGFSVSIMAPWLLLRRRCWPHPRDRPICIKWKA